MLEKIFATFTEAQTKAKTVRGLLVNLGKSLATKDSNTLLIDTMEIREVLMDLSPIRGRLQGYVDTFGTIKARDKYEISEEVYITCQEYLSMLKSIDEQAGAMLLTTNQFVKIQDKNNL